MLRETDYLLGPSRVSDDVLVGVINRLDGPDAKDQQFLMQLRHWCRVAGVDDGNAITQFLHETGNATAPRWNEDTNADGAIDLNPGGIGIPSNSTVQPFKIANVDESARIFVNCIYALVKKQAHPDVPIPANAQDWFTRVWLAKVNHPNFPTVRRVADLNIRYAANNDQHATWAWDDQYPAKLVSRAKQFMPGLPDQGTVTRPTEPEPEEPDMSIPYPAPPLRISIMPYGNANRPKLAMDPEYITVHEVGNTSPGANEEMHRQFVHNGGGPSQVSFQFVAGPSEVIQLMPIDEAAWHASDGYNGTGNRKSIAIETIQIGDFNKTLWNLAWLINELATNPGRFYANQRRDTWKLSINRIKQHNDWAPDNKNCPQFIRDRGLWPTLMSRVDAWNAAGQPAPEPEPEPEPIPEPQPGEKHTLPKGMSKQLARRLFGRFVAPWDSTEYGFDLTQAPSQVWLARGKRSIPDGGTWEDGTWPELNSVIRRGNGDEVWVWSDGSTYERQAPAQDDAA